MNRLIQWIAIVLVVLINVGSVRGQEDEQHIDRLLLRQTLNQAEIYNLNADGSTTLIATLEDISFNGILSEWNVLVAVDVAPSPDGQHIAFTAINYQENQIALFVIGLNPFRVTQYEAEDIAAIEWSPASDALLLRQPSIYIGSRIGESGKYYVFDLATETYTLIAETDSTHTVQNAIWSPTGTHIILTLEPRRNSDELFISELYSVMRDGSEIRPLTNLFEQAPQVIDFDEPYVRGFCQISQVRWSENNARFYYILVCNESDFISLFSVDIEGSNRLEVDLFDEFPKEFSPKPGNFLPKLIDVYVDTPNGVYLVVDSPEFNLIFIQIISPTEAEIIYSTEPDESLFSAISPDKTRIAYTDRIGIAGVIDLTTGSATTLDQTMDEASVCRVQWLNNQTVLVDQVNICGQLNQQFFTVQKTIAWTPETDTLESITDTLGDGIKLIIPLPEVPEILLDGIAEP